MRPVILKKTRGFTHFLKQSSASSSKTLSLDCFEKHGEVLSFLKQVACFSRNDSLYESQL